MSEEILETVNIEVVENGWLVEVDREDDCTKKHIFERQEDMLMFIDGITGGMNSDVIAPGTVIHAHNV